VHLNDRAAFNIETNRLRILAYIGLFLCAYVRAADLLTLDVALLASTPRLLVQKRSLLNAHNYGTRLDWIILFDCKETTTNAMKLRFDESSRTENKSDWAECPFA